MSLGSANNSIKIFGKNLSPNLQTQNHSTPKATYCTFKPTKLHQSNYDIQANTENKTTKKHYYEAGDEITCHKQACKECAMYKYRNAHTYRPAQASCVTQSQSITKQLLKNTVRNKTGATFHTLESRLIGCDMTTIPQITTKSTVVLTRSLQSDCRNKFVHTYTHPTTHNNEKLAATASDVFYNHN